MPRKKVKTVKELMLEHRALMEEAEEQFKKAREACRVFYEENVKPALRKQEEESKKVLKARDSIDRDLIISREKVQSELNKARRRRNELLRDLAGFDAAYKATKSENDKRLSDLCSLEIKRIDTEIAALGRKFTAADKEVEKAIEEALASLPV